MPAWEVRSTIIIWVRSAALRVAFCLVWVVWMAVGLVLVPSDKPRLSIPAPRENHHLLSEIERNNQAASSRNEHNALLAASLRPEALSLTLHNMA